MADGMMSPAEAQLLANDGGNMWGGGGAFFWIFALLILAGGNFGFGGGSRGDYVTNAELTNQLNAQSTQNQLQGLAVETANNNYETALLINNQTSQMLQQNNTNLINAIQGFNTVNQNMQSGFNDLGQRLDQIGYQMDQCCCKILTQMLQNRLDDANAALVAAQNNISNYNQSQYILSQLGKFVMNPPATAA
jgi:hypothetical protein